MFRKLGYSEAIATILALICSEPEIDEVRLDGKTYYVAKNERFLPQGAPTSPAVTNIICRGLDARLSRTAETLGFNYTRYADDMTFSGSGEASMNVGRVLRRIQHAVGGENFEIHPEKTRVLRRSRRQEVTGLVVNERVNVSRKMLRKFRAVLFQIERDGPAGKRWGNGDDVIASIEGFANFVAMVDSEKGKRFQDQVQAIIDRHGRGGGKAHAQRNRWVTRPSTEPIISQEELSQSEPILAQAVEEATPPQSAETMQIDTTQNHSPQRPKKPWWKFW